MGCKPIFPSFPSPFSLSSLPMLSPLSKILLLLRLGDGVAGGGWARWPTTVGGGAAARATPFYIFFLFFFGLFLSSGHGSEPKIAKKGTLSPRSKQHKEARKKKSTFGSTPHGFGFRYGCPTSRSFPLLLLL